MRKHDERSPIVIEPLPGARYEARDVAVGTIVKWVVILFALMGGCAAIALVFYNLVQQPPGVANFEFPLANERRIPPSPVVQAYPLEDIRTFRQKEDQAVTGYSWVDQTAGIVRIPIDIALDKVAQQGPSALLPSTAPPTPYTQATNTGLPPAPGPLETPSTQGAAVGGPTVNPGLPDHPQPSTNEPNGGGPERTAPITELKP